MNGDKRIDFSKFFFTRQFKRWDALVEVYPELARLDEASLDCVSDVLKECFEQAWKEGAKCHPNKNSNVLWESFFKANSGKL